MDPETRHGHKTAARGFDGYKGHLSIDPDSKFITTTAVSAGNAGDASVAKDLITDLQQDATTSTETTNGDASSAAEPADADAAAADEPVTDESATANGESGAGTLAGQIADADDDAPVFYGDNAYGTGEFQKHLDQAGIEPK